MRKVFIVGGGVHHNTGAQSMTFIAASEAKRRLPDHEICDQYDYDYRLPQSEKDRYSFDIIDNFSFHTLCHLAGGLPRIYARLRGDINQDELANAQKQLHDLDAMIDVSGYAFGSTWKMRIVLPYLLRIMAAKRYGAKVYLMPQSFGPFDFKGLKGWLIRCIAPIALSKADMIFAREQEGYQHLVHRYKLRNVHQSCDLVLQNSGIDPADIYSSPQPSRDLMIKGSLPVAIFPNKQTQRFRSESGLIELYKTVIERLRSLGRTVYIMYHSPNDRAMCEHIKQQCPDDDGVVFWDELFSCFDFEHIMGQLDFVIASRYHAIVHAYKQGTPCIVLGWATKYGELLSMFSQQQYMFDLRSDVVEAQIIDAIEQMHTHHAQESKRIKDALPELQRQNVFDCLGPIITQKK